jgi:hypothetical protein
LRTLIFARAGNLSVGEHMTQMRAWLAERDIVPRELTMLYVLHMRVVFRAIFDADHEAQQFIEVFGVEPAA